MKKVISVLLICATLLSTACLFTGCGGDDYEDTYTGSPQYYKDASDYFKKHPDELYK